MRILVIENNEKIRLKICKIVRNEDFEVFEASNGIEGIEKAEKLIPDLIIADKSSSIAGGFQFVKTLKKSVYTQNIPLIFLLNSSSQMNFLYTVKSQADDILVKPILSEDLLFSIQRIIDRNFKLDQILINYGINMTKLTTIR